MKGQNQREGLPVEAEVDLGVGQLQLQLPKVQRSASEQGWWQVKQSGWQPPVKPKRGVGQLLEQFYSVIMSQVHSEGKDVEYGNLEDLRCLFSCGEM